MLGDLKLQPLQQRRLESRLVMLYKIVRGMVPAINTDEVLIPIRNKRQIKAKTHQDCYTSNFMDREILNNSDVLKYHCQTHYFVKSVSDWNCLPDIHICAETVSSFKTAVHTYVTCQ